MRGDERVGVVLVRVLSNAWVRTCEDGLLRVLFRLVPSDVEAMRRIVGDMEPTAADVELAMDHLGRAVSEAIAERDEAEARLGAAMDARGMVSALATSFRFPDITLTRPMSTADAEALRVLRATAAVEVEEVEMEPLVAIELKRRGS